MTVKEDTRTLSDILVNYSRNNDIDKFAETLPLFVASQTHSEEFKYQRFKSVFENACSFNCFAAVKIMLEDEHCFNLIIPNNSKSNRYDLFKNGLFISVFHSHEKTLNVLESFSQEYFKTNSKEDLYLELLEASIEGNSSKYIKKYIDELNVLSDKSDHFFNKIVLMSAYKPKTVKLESGQLVNSAIYVIENCNISKIKSESLNQSLFTAKLDSENLELMNYLVMNNILELSDKQLECVKNNPNSTFNKILFNHKLSSDLQLKNNDVGRKIKI